MWHGKGSAPPCVNQSYGGGGIEVSCVTFTTLLGLALTWGHYRIVPWIKYQSTHMLHHCHTKRWWFKAVAWPLFQQWAKSVYSHWLWWIWVHLTINWILASELYSRIVPVQSQSFHFLDPSTAHSTTFEVREATYSVLLTARGRRAELSLHEISKPEIPLLSKGFLFSVSRSFARTWSLTGCLAWPRASQIWVICLKRKTNEIRTHLYRQFADFFPLAR